MAGHNCDSANSAAFLDFTIVPPAMLLTHYAACHDFTAAKSLAQIGEVLQNFECFLDWEVDSELCMSSAEIIVA